MALLYPLRSEVWSDDAAVGNFLSVSTRHIARVRRHELEFRPILAGGVVASPICVPVDTSGLQIQCLTTPANELDLLLVMCANSLCVVGFEAGELVEKNSYSLSPLTSNGPSIDFTFASYNSGAGIVLVNSKQRSLFLLGDSRKSSVAQLSSLKGVAIWINSTHIVGAFTTQSKTELCILEAVGAQLQFRKRAVSSKARWKDRLMIEGMVLVSKNILAMVGLGEFLAVALKRDWAGNPTAFGVERQRRLAVRQRFDGFRSFEPVHATAHTVILRVDYSGHLTDVVLNVATLDVKVSDFAYQRRHSKVPMGLNLDSSCPSESVLRQVHVDQLPYTGSLTAPNVQPDDSIGERENIIHIFDQDSMKSIVITTQTELSTHRTIRNNEVFRLEMHTWTLDRSRLEIVPWASLFLPGVKNVWVTEEAALVITSKSQTRIVKTDGIKYIPLTHSGWSSDEPTLTVFGDWQVTPKAVRGSNGPIFTPPAPAYCACANANLIVLACDDGLVYEVRPHRFKVTSNHYSDRILSLDLDPEGKETLICTASVVYWCDMEFKVPNGAFSAVLSRGRVLIGALNGVLWSWTSDGVTECIKLGILPVQVTPTIAHCGNTAFSISPDDLSFSKVYIPSSGHGMVSSGSYPGLHVAPADRGLEIVDTTPSSELTMSGPGSISEVDVSWDSGLSDVCFERSSSLRYDVGYTCTYASPYKLVSRRFADKTSIVTEHCITLRNEPDTFFKAPLGLSFSPGGDPSEFDILLCLGLSQPYRRSGPWTGGAVIYEKQADGSWQCYHRNPLFRPMHVYCPVMFRLPTLKDRKARVLLGGNNISGIILEISEFSHVVREVATTGYPLRNRLSGLFENPLQFCYWGNSAAFIDIVPQSQNQQNSSTQCISETEVVKIDSGTLSRFQFVSPRGRPTQTISLLPPVDGSAFPDMLGIRNRNLILFRGSSRRVLGELSTLQTGDELPDSKLLVTRPDPRLTSYLEKLGPLKRCFAPELILGTRAQMFDNQTRPLGGLWAFCRIEDRRVYKDLKRLEDAMHADLHDRLPTLVMTEAKESAIMVDGRYVHLLLQSKIWTRERIYKRAGIAFERGEQIRHAIGVATR